MHDQKQGNGASGASAAEQAPEFSVAPDQTGGDNGSSNIGVEQAASRPSPALPYPLVAVGASAGGLQAFVSFWSTSQRQPE